MTHKRKRRIRAPFLLLITVCIALIVVIAGRCKNAAEAVATAATKQSEQVAGKLKSPAVTTVVTTKPVKAEAPEQVTEGITATEEITEETESLEIEPVRNERYAAIEMTDEERELMAKVVYLEAGNQSFEGQQAVVEVILNRVLNGSFPDTVGEVLWAKGQFSVMSIIDTATPTQTQYDAIDAALYGETVLDIDVVFFARGPENNRIWGQIGDHYFCREYVWE